MKRFLKHTVLFLIPVLIIMIAMEVALRHIPNDYDLKNTQIALKKESIKTLILGSSHSLYGFNPEYFSEETYNLAHLSQTIDLDYLLLKKYINELPKLKTVVIRLSYTTLHEQLNESTESWRQKDYNLYYNLNVSNTLKLHSEVLSVKLKNNLKRLKSYYLEHEESISIINSGWAFFEDSHAMKSIEELGFTVAKKHTAKDNNLVLENIEFLEKIVKLCNEHSVNLILVTLPAHKSYRDNLETSQLEMLVSAGEKMKMKYSNCNYLNLLEVDNFTETDFYDADHLNTNGAKKLSILINDFIMQSHN